VQTVWVWASQSTPCEFRRGALAVLLAAAFWPAFAVAQQTGRIEGTVTLRDSTSSVAGIRVAGESDAMPRARSTVTDD